MERLQAQRPSGIGRNGLRTWGMLFLAANVLSRSILQNRLLGMGSLTSQELLEAMQVSEQMMNYATFSIVLEIIGTCAVPIFAFLLAEGARNTRDLNKYLFRVAGVAVLSELPYNYAMSGKLMDLSTRNPVFGLVLTLVVIWFFQRYTRKKAADVLVRVVVTVAAVLWCGMLRVENGMVLVLTGLTLWLLWKKPLLRNMAGASVVLLCSMGSLFLMAAPMSFLAIHFYNGEKGEDNRLVNYLAYPAMLLAAGIAGKFLI